MEILPPLRATLNLVAFMANLINLKQFNTILVLYDQSTQNEINFVIENVPTRYDIAWILVNEDDNPEYWSETTIQNQNLLILTAVQSNNINPLLKRLYNKNVLQKRSKNLIISSDVSELANEILSPLYTDEINAILVDCGANDDAVIFAWNPYDASTLITLNETEFLRGSNAAAASIGKYSGLFFDQLQNMRGKSTTVLSLYDPTNVYNVMSKDSVVASIDGTEIRIIELIGEAIQSSMEYLVIKAASFYKNKSKRFGDFLDQTYRSYDQMRRRNTQILTLEEW